ncbi:MAG: hypothetical protein JWN69_787 [Alphaproteobacteria bacterium]|nr:hypothetical protein [Alphaproteobacteria bacterium]
MGVVDEEGMGSLEIFPLSTEESTLRALLTDVFTEHWANIRFGTLIQGAVFEIAAPNAPKKISMMDGYMTVDFGAWHFHLCIGQHCGNEGHPVSSKLAQHRRTARAEMYRIVNGGSPTSWGLRLYNGAGEQQITVMLPNPFLSEETGLLSTPDWTQLAVWDRLRSRYLGLECDPRDRSAKAFVHP